jgi:rhamnose transport system permease protein
VIAALRSWEGFLFAALIVLVVANAAVTPQYLTIGNQINLFQLSIEKVIVALMMTLVIINGEIDLSVGSMMGLAACSFGFLYQIAGVDAWLAVAIVLLIGVAGGALNAAFIVGLGLPSLVVTLATLIGYRGLARVLVEDRGLGDFPDWFDALGQDGLLGPLPLGIVSFFALFALLYVVLHRSGFGRRNYVIGLNRDVAAYSGIATGRHKTVLFVASGLVASFAGLLFAARLGAVRGDVAFGFELDIVTIVLLGGASIYGGRGSMAGTLLSVLIILNLRNGMGLLNITGHIQNGVTGVLLIASVLAPRADPGRIIGAVRRRGARSRTPT